MTSKEYVQNLTDEELTLLCWEAPWEALDYAADRLTPEHIDICIKQSSWAPLVYAPHLLSAAQLDACYRDHCELALSRVAHRLTPEQLDYCCWDCPMAALEHAAHLLTSKQLAFCYMRCQWIALEHAADKVNQAKLNNASCEQEQKAYDDLVETIAKRSPEEVLLEHLHCVPIIMIRKAAYYSPEIAYQVAMSRDPKITLQMKALLLSYSTRVSHNGGNKELERYKGLIANTLINHSDIWLRTFGGDWMDVMYELQNERAIDFGLVFPSSYQSAIRFP